MNMKYRKKHVPKRKGDDVFLTPGRTKTQTVRREGQRVTITQTMLSDGSVKTKVEQAHTLEADLQTEQVIRLKKREDYESRFLLAGDQNAAKRGPKAAAEAKRTGMEAGEPDLRLYVRGPRGRDTVFIENKNGGNYASKEQKQRHAELTALGFSVYIIKTDSVDLAADLAEEVLDHHLYGKTLNLTRPELSLII